MEQTKDARREENRMSPNLVRWSGLAAMLGGVLGIILTPILEKLQDKLDRLRELG
jgi:hypothetical protein